MPVKLEKRLYYIIRARFDRAREKFSFFGRMAVFTTLDRHGATGRPTAWWGQP